MLLLYLAALLQLLCKYVQRWKTLEKEDGRMGGRPIGMTTKEQMPQ